jgi:hypothetical protein
METKEKGIISYSDDCDRLRIMFKDTAATEASVENGDWIADPLMDWLGEHDIVYDMQTVGGFVDGSGNIYPVLESELWDLCKGRATTLTRSCVLDEVWVGKANDLEERTMRQGFYDWYFGANETNENV